MSERKALSKRTRFEVFKRDGFRCVYCGASPVQSALHVDHVIPVAEGGTNDPSNLATACDGCNLGKGAVQLEHKKLSLPVATEATQDHAEQIREYLQVQREIDQARTAAAEELATYWEQVIGPMSQDMFDRLKRIITEWRHEQLIEAIDITARKMGGHSNAMVKQAKYFQGILRNWRERSEG